MLDIGYKLTGPQEYELTEAQFQELMDASQPVPYMVFGGVEPQHPQDKAEAVWQRIAMELGVVWRSITRSSKGDHFFMAQRLVPAKEGTSA